MQYQISLSVVVMSHVLWATPPFSRPVVAVEVRSMRFLLFLISSPHTDDAKRCVVGFLLGFFGSGGEFFLGFGLDCFRKGQKLSHSVVQILMADRQAVCS